MKMALRLDPNCRLALTSAKHGEHQVSHVFCASRQYGVRCMLERIPGKKVYVLCGECFKSVSGPGSER